MKFRLECHKVLESTSSLVKQRAEAGEAEGLAIQALRQSAGRGRQGRGWDSPAGNLYLSVLLRPEVPLRDAPQWSFVAAVALAETLNAFLPEAATPKLKWPNDLLLQGAKAAGILVETGIAPSHALDWICVGIGVNIMSKPSLPDRHTACLAEYLAAPPAPEALTQSLLESLAHWHGIMLQQGFAPIREAWLLHAPAMGAAISLKRDGGLLEGAFAGLSPEGGLLLAKDNQVQLILAGEIM
ncbi:MAG: biotin--[acetyl-CoA-carboxylase] ligase [Roseomonas sp.]|nr:biotin--[acetyl-CoA-carboxylase] ligase [Roseomonas sp.]MCA3289617.1 biotin--[acetyl-CoA-carboxylase] ligase [Roseomonas sp.]MCA3293248.1 biotin--[acetyl-CoA-carboxylase] ligase [Roseomonas sp.]